MDEVADIIASVLGVTEVAAASSGPSKAKYRLDGAIAEGGRKRCAELLRRFPLYPTVQL